VNMCGPAVTYDTSYNPNGSLVQVCGTGTPRWSREEWQVTVRLKNTGSGVATNVHATLAVNGSSAVGAVITSGNPGSYGTLAEGPQHGHLPVPGGCGGGVREQCDV